MKTAISGFSRHFSGFSGFQDISGFSGHFRITEKFRSCGMPEKMPHKSIFLLKFKKRWKYKK